MITKQDISAMSTKSDLAETKAEIVKWVAGMLVAQVAVGVALFKLLSGG